MAIALGIVLSCVTGCGEPAKHEIVLSESTKCMHDLVEIVTRVKNEQDAKVALPGARAILKDWRRLVREIRDIGKVQPELYLYFDQQGAPLRKAERLYYAELERLRRVAECKAFVDTLSGDINPDKP